MPPILPPYTKTVSAMTKRELIDLCDRFDQPTVGTVKQLRTRMNTYLRNHQNDLQNNPQFAALYPRRRGRRAPSIQPEPPIEDDEENEPHEPVFDANEQDDEELSEISSHRTPSIPTSSQQTHVSSPAPPANSERQPLSDHGHGRPVDEPNDHGHPIFERGMSPLPNNHSPILQLSDMYSRLFCSSSLFTIPHPLTLHSIPLFHA